MRSFCTAKVSHFPSSPSFLSLFVCETMKKLKVHQNWLYTTKICPLLPNFCLLNAFYRTSKLHLIPEHLLEELWYTWSFCPVSCWAACSEPCCRFLDQFQTFSRDRYRKQTVDTVLIHLSCWCHTPRCLETNGLYLFSYKKGFSPL